MTKDGNCIVCGLAPQSLERPNGCAGLGACKPPKIQDVYKTVQKEKAVVEEVVEKVEKPKKKTTPKKKAAKKA